MSAPHDLHAIEVRWGGDRGPGCCLGQGEAPDGIPGRRACGPGPVRVRIDREENARLRVSIDADQTAPKGRGCRHLVRRWQTNKRVRQSTEFACMDRRRERRMFFRAVRGNCYSVPAPVLIIVRLIVHLFRSLRSHRGAFALRRPIRKSALVRGARTALRTISVSSCRTAEAPSHTSRTAKRYPLPCIDLQPPTGGSPR